MKRIEGLIYEPGSNTVYDVTIYRGFVVRMPNGEPFWFQSFFKNFLTCLCP